MLASNGWGGYIRFGDKRFIEITNANPLYTKEAAEKDLKAVWGFLNTTNIPTILEEPDSWFDFFKKNLEPSKAHKAGYSAGKSQLSLKTNPKLHPWSLVVFQGSILIKSTILGNLPTRY